MVFGLASMALLAVAQGWFYACQTCSAALPSSIYQHNYNYDLWSELNYQAVTLFIEQYMLDHGCVALVLGSCIGVWALSLWRNFSASKRATLAGRMRKLSVMFCLLAGINLFLARASPAMVNGNSRQMLWAGMQVFWTLLSAILFSILFGGLVLVRHLPSSSEETI
jgi:hypothetical protein